MNELRWILIGFGIILLAGIYLWGRRGNTREGAPGDPALRSRPEPTLQGGDFGSFRAEDDTRAHASAELEEPLGDELEQPAVSMNGPVGGPMGGSVGAPLGAREPRRVSAPAAPPVGEQSWPAPGDTWQRRTEPTFGDGAATEELPVEPEPAPVPTLSSSESPPPRRIERRKILSLRLSLAPQRVQGDKLLECLLAESLQHGKYDVFHRLHTDGTAILSIASMIEPGTFDMETMPDSQYPGITLFAQLPGPVPGMHALNELVACARKLQAGLGGTLQDERGVPLTVHRIERMRQEVRDFERPPAAGGRSGSPSHGAHS